MILKSRPRTGRQKDRQTHAQIQTQTQTDRCDRTHYSRSSQNVINCAYSCRVVCICITYNMKHTQRHDGS